MKTFVLSFKVNQPLRFNFTVYFFIGNCAVVSEGKATSPVSFSKK